ncbi:MAG: metal ABC transporter permease [Verrucomicrobiota bacterium]
MLSEPFMQRALLAALFLGPMCGLLGVFVTARRMSFFSDTVAHAALAGVAAGFLLGFEEPTVAVVAFCLAVALAMLWLKERTDLLNDTILALLLSSSVALGVVLLSLQRSRWAELDKYLFGDILSVGWSDVSLTAVVALGTGLVLFLQLNALVLVTAHEDLAHVSGLPVRRLNYAFVILLTLTVSLGVRLLGVILITSLVVLPAAAARNLARNLRQQILGSIALGGLGAAGGVLVSYPTNLPTGPTVTLSLAALFAVSLGVSLLRRRAVPPSAAPAPAPPPASPP